MLSRSVPGFLAMAFPDGEFLAAEGTAPLIWGSFDEPRSVDAVARSLATTFGAPVEVVRADVDAFVSTLLDGGWLVAEQPRP